MFFDDYDEDLEYEDYVEMCLAQGVCPDCGGWLVYDGIDDVMVCPNCGLVF